MYDRPNLTTNTTSIRGDPQNKDTCPRCGGIVFHAERMLSKNNVRKKNSKKFQKKNHKKSHYPFFFVFQSFHKKCFTCFDCKRPLDSTTVNDGPNNEIFCKACYGKNFGPKGYGFGGSSVPALMAGEPGQFAEDRLP